MGNAEKASRKRQLLPRILIFLAVVTVGVVVASAAFAGWTTINLTNGSIDTIWGTASYSELTNDASITDRDDIKNAWVRYDGSNMYFRIETFAGPVLSSNNNRAAGAIDCNHDGDFNDPYSTGPDGDRLVIYAPDNSVNIYGYNTSGTLTFLGAVAGDWSDPIRASVTTNIEWGVPLALLPPACRGSANPVNIGWSTGTGAGAIIDQSSTPIELSNPMDFGDTVQTLPAPPATCAAPDTATGLQCNGARHGIVPMTPGVPLRLGLEAVDADPGNLQSGNSDADDTSGTTPDDEEGIAPDPANSWSDGSGVLNFQIVGAASARLGCWIDFNKNGVWTDTGENVVNNVTLNSSATIRNITIPGGLAWPNSFPARCRIWQNPGANTPTPVPQPSGPIEFGEVEDHIWSFDANGFYIAPVTITPTPTPTATNTPPTPVAITNLAIARDTNPANAKLTWTNPAPNDSVHVYSNPVNPYFTPADVNAADRGTVNNPTNQFIEPNVLGDTTVQTIYYIVLGRVGLVEAGPSNRVGLFEFSLIAGAP